MSCGVVVWRGVVWCGVVWCGVVWSGVVWCGVVWCGGVVWCRVVSCGADEAQAAMRACHVPAHVRRVSESLQDPELSAVAAEVLMRLNA